MMIKSKKYTCSEYISHLCDGKKCNNCILILSKKQEAI
jgi:hypothetical protein